MAGNNIRDPDLRMHDKIYGYGGKYCGLAVTDRKPNSKTPEIYEEHPYFDEIVYVWYDRYCSGRPAILGLRKDSTKLSGI